MYRPAFASETMAVTSVVAGILALVGVFVPLPFLPVPRLAVCPAVSALGLTLGIRALRRSGAGRRTAVAGVTLNSLFFLSVVIVLVE